MAFSEEMMTSPIANQDATDCVEYDERDEEDLLCEICGGDGGDPMSDYCFPCPACDGEGYKWWL